MGLKRITALLCVLVLLLCLAAPAVKAAEGDTVYVRKHVSLLYDNSGSMKMKLTGAKNLKWAYGSYAAQMFAGLLNGLVPPGHTIGSTFNILAGEGHRHPLHFTLGLDVIAFDHQRQVDG